MESWELMFVDEIREKQRKSGNVGKRAQVNVYHDFDHSLALSAPILTRLFPPLD